MRLNLKARVLSLAVLPVLLFALIISVSTVIMLRDQAKREVEDTRQHLLAEAKATLQSYVAVAMGTIKPLYDASAPGDMEARAQVIKMLSQVQYAKDGYFSATTPRPFACSRAAVLTASARVSRMRATPMVFT